jgi:uncharacterized protein DUF4375
MRTDPFYALESRILDQLAQVNGEISVLSEQERVIFLVNMLIGDVLNGGFHQYFYNSSGTNHHETERSLMAIGATEEANLLIQARQVFFPDGAVPSNVMERRAKIPFPFEAPETNWPKKSYEELDKVFYEGKSEESLSQRLKDFAREQGLILAKASLAEAD